MPNSTSRTPILDYWYTTAQIREVGNAWARAGVHRLFVTPEQITPGGVDVWADEVVNITGLKAFHLNAVTGYPFHVMLPLNRGRSHWTSIAISISEHPTVAARKIIKLSFSDSLGTRIPSEVQHEMNRMAALLREKYGSEQVEITQSFYAHSWQQSDMSSCAPYSLKNAERCLAGDGARVNPGREAIRREQLDAMREATAIKACSTNNQIDDILAHWIITRTAEGQSYQISSVRGVKDICAAFALAKAHDLLAIQELFIDEFGLEYGLERGIPAEELMRYRPVIARMRELVEKNELVRKVLSADQREALLKPLRSENTCQKFEDIRNIILKTHDEASSYLLTAEIIELITQLNVDAAEKRLHAIISKPDDLKRCLVAISEMVGSRSLEKDYTLKLIAMAKNFRAIAESSHKCDAKSITPSTTPRESTSELAVASEDETLPPATMPVANAAKTRALLDAQINLVNAAIRRNNASLLMHIAYVLSDFCEAIFEIVTGGLWQPEFRRLQAIEKALSIPFVGVTSEHYQAELDSLILIRDSLPSSGPEERRPLLSHNQR
jgi:hypothetical protein